jgi:hypothetical protein
VTDLPIHHIYPEGDTREHFVDGGPCWCNPVTETVCAKDDPLIAVGYLIIHTAADGRSNQERQFLSGAN